MGVENTQALRNLETFGAGLVALLFVFVLLFFLMKEGVPAFKAAARSIVDAVNRMGDTMDRLNETMVAQQAASIASINALEKRILSMEQRLDTHIDTACRIESRVDSAGVSLAEIKERVRNCGKGDK